MTRFARAKGSKASNIKTPEDSTPWEVMKEQLMKSKHDNEEASKREEAEKQRVENYNKFLKELKTQKRQATWCDFPETSQVKKPKIAPPALKTMTKKRKNKNNKSNTAKDVPQINTQIDGETSAVDNKKEKNKEKTNTPHLDVNINKTSAKEIPEHSVKKNHKIKETLNKNSTNNLDDSNIPQKETFEPNKKHKKMLKDKPVNGNDNGEEASKFPKNKNKKKLKQKNGQPTRRKAMNDQSFELIINGKNIDLVRFDGFPIMKKDAERLQELKINMIKKGIPKSEVQRTMKLERRRAEKALARIKREVCYNCRKGGHNLSDCPDLKSNIPGKEGGEGICFKCGSTEHRQFECKVQRDMEFRFATCFICKESGHIARQCPDNPKGLYPNGGNCKLCGDVTHLRKDCPTVQDKREGSSIKLQTLDMDNVEDIGQQTTKVQEEKQRKPKKIKF